jgi:hypothetical protein
LKERRKIIKKEKERRKNGKRGKLLAFRKVDR